MCYSNWTVIMIIIKSFTIDVHFVTIHSNLMVFTVVWTRRFSFYNNLYPLSFMCPGAQNKPIENVPHAFQLSNLNVHAAHQRIAIIHRESFTPI